LAWSEQQCRDFQRRIAERVVDVQIDTGYLILVNVIGPKRQIYGAQRILQESRQRAYEAETLLAEAERLGILLYEPEDEATEPAAIPT
jgi:hypothetical protein